ncbi:iron-containing alcohol dehydrogenase [Reinekea blandensis]|uniref:Putative iron-containing alcohol dehydrogenase n=1 Tax=Reinekea blandensis MED297 TaxID=314283 RepID=A4BDH1_9GAMM|nr:iron-containing alcohol dehydrogenase [Reinekea blandensis]EAR09915.1 putative iron-containing alcohol dehydrogenase [Reinekea sp. MED297] [Reinekea blandensis MED297]
MNRFTFQNTTRIHFGEGQIAAITKDIPADARVLVTYGGGSIKKNGVYDQVADALKDHTWAEFSGIEPNPKYDTLMKAVTMIQEEGYDYLLAVGGGSVVDGTKFIAAAAEFAGDPWDICQFGATIERALPLGCVLTLPATGSESNTGGVITRGTDKLPFGSELVRPIFAVLDPAVTLTLPERQVANGVIDAFVHIMEQYMTYPVNAKVQDRFAEGLLMTLMEEGPKALNDPKDLDVRANIMWAATLALNGLIGAGVPQDWATHMIGHELTALHGIDHARTLSIVFPAVLKFQRDSKKDKLLQFGERAFGITEGDDNTRIDQTIARIVDFFHEMGVPAALSEADLTADAIDPLVDNLKAHKMGKLGEHRAIGFDESRAILELAV